MDIITKKGNCIAYYEDNEFIDDTIEPSTMPESQ